MVEAKQNIAFRLAPSEIARVDALVSRHSTPYMAATRSDVLRALVLRGLEQDEDAVAKEKMSKPARERVAVAKVAEGSKGDE